MWLRVLASGVAQVSMAPSPAGAAKAAVPYVCIAVSCRWTEVMRITGLEDLQSLAWGVSWAEPRPCPQRPGPSGVLVGSLWPQGGAFCVP